MPGDMPGTPKARKVGRPNQGNAPTSGDRPNPPTGGQKGKPMRTADNGRQVGKPDLGENSQGPRKPYRKTIGNATIYPN